MIGNRFSSLPIAQYCAKAPAINVGAGRAAAISSCFHARCAGEEKWRQMYDRLDPKEQAEVDDMRYPATILLIDGLVLDYESAEKEIPLGLDASGNYVPKGHAAALTEGTADMAWVRDGVAYVADIKRSEWTTQDGPDSLQVVGYALAYCSREFLDVHAFVTGIWAAQEGLWTWGEYIEVGSARHAELLAKVLAAAAHTEGDFATGNHCRTCYSRTRCPAFMVPPEHAADGIARYLTGELDNAKALELRRFYERMQATMEAMDEASKAYAAQAGGIRDDEAGKVWKAIPTSGRVTLDRKALEADHPELVQKYMKTGKPGHQHRWVNITM